MHVNDLNYELNKKIVELEAELRCSVTNSKLMQSIIDGFVSKIQHLVRNHKTSIKRNSENEGEYIRGRIELNSELWEKNQ